MLTIQQGGWHRRLDKKHHRSTILSVSAGQFGVFISTGTGAYGSVTKPIAYCLHVFSFLGNPRNCIYSANGLL